MNNPDKLANPKVSFKSPKSSKKRKRNKNKVILHYTGIWV